MADRDRQATRGILVEQQLAATDIGERPHVLSRKRALEVRGRPARCGRASARIGEVLVAGVELQVAEAVHVPDMGDQRAVLRSRRPGASRPTSSAGSSGSPASATEAPPASAAVDGREDVAPVEGRRDGLQAKRGASDVGRLRRCRPPARRRASAARCRPDENGGRPRVRRATARRSAPTSGSTTARWTPDRHEGQRLGEHDRAGARVVAADAVGEIDDPGRGQSVAITPWQTPTKSSARP